MHRSNAQPHVARLLVFSLLVASTAFLFVPAIAAEHHETRAFELRTYIAEDGKLEDLHRRFREHTVALFEKHGMDVIGFWTPTDGEGAATTLVYLLAYPSAEARTKSWKAFIDDPVWKKVYADSHKNGKLVKKVESTMLAPTDYSAIQ